HTYLLLRTSTGLRCDMQAGALGRHRETAIVEVGCASPLWRNHTGTNRCFRGAGSAEDLAFPGLDHAFEHLSALASFGVRNAQSWHLVAQLGIPLGKLWTQL